MKNMSADQFQYTEIEIELLCDLFNDESSLLEWAAENQLTTNSYVVRRLNTLQSISSPQPGPSGNDLTYPTSSFQPSLSEVELNQLNEFLNFHEATPEKEEETNSSAAVNCHDKSKKRKREDVADIVNESEGKNSPEPKKRRRRTVEKDFICSSCSRGFKYYRNYEKHVSLCKSKFTCSKCDRKFNSDEQRTKHIQSAHPVSSAEGKREGENKLAYNCRECNESFNNRSELYLHQGEQHGKGEDRLHDSPWAENPPWVNEKGEIDDELKKVIQANRGHIQANHRIGNLTAEYNFPTNNLQRGMEEIEDHLEKIYEAENETFKVNVGLGIILRNIESGKCRYFIPYENSALFPVPMDVNSHRDLSEIREELARPGIDNYFIQNRPNTKWKAEIITNITYFISRTGFNLGRGFLPDFLKRAKCIIGLDSGVKGKPIEDSLCAFRCLALHNSQVDIEAAVVVYYKKWKEYLLENMGKTISSNPKLYAGVPLSLISEFERCFKVSIYIYEMKEDKEKTVILRVKPSTHFQSVLYMNVYENHLSYINDFKVYAKKFQCALCGRCHNRLFNYKQHIRTCARRTRYTFKEGFYSNPPTVFQKLEQLGIIVPKEKQFYEYFAVFDCEALLEKTDPGHAEKLKWTHCHKPISVSIASNVIGYENPFCIVNEDPKILIKSMLNYLFKIQVQAEENARKKWSEELEKLDKVKQKWRNICHKKGEKENEELTGEEGEEEEEEEDEGREGEEWEVEVEEEDGEGMGEGGDEEGEEEINMSDGDNCSNKKKVNKQDLRMMNFIEKVEQHFEEYISSIPVLGFNSAKYDLNLLKMEILKELELHNSEGFVIKRNNSYVTISAKRLRFLDISQYLAPGVSYSKFLAAYKIQEKKGYFCYEYLDSVEKLNDTNLPPHEKFYSSMKKANISKEEYELIQEIWVKENMKTLKDYLIYYNNLDVGPFVKAVEKLQLFYFERKIDIFKIAVSVPGVARRLLFEYGADAGAHFPLISGENEDLYFLFKKNIVGGPAIVFSRKQKKNETKIKGGPKICKKILGYDANALYLWGISQDMPTETYIRRYEEEDFKPRKHSKYQMMFIWLEWERTKTKRRIIHSRNNGGREVRIGPYLADGYDPDNQVIFEYYGCYFHGCDCKKNKMSEKERLKKLEYTQLREEFIKRQGYSIVNVWECQFKAELESTPEVKLASEKFFPEFYRQYPRSVSMNTILEGVRSGIFFGMLEVDISIPDKWDKKISPYEYFSEMCPLFCTIDVKSEDVGEHMLEHILKHKLSTKPRRLLVSGVKGKKMLLLSTLLKWYLEHGLEVSRIYQVIEFIPKRCFKTFEQEITNARREGDRDPNQSVIADTMKLIGNSAYGGVIMDKEKQHKVSYYTKRHKAAMAINSPRFRKANEISSTFFEIESAKGRISLDMPIYLGYTILQYAKLKMLAFYYDCLDRFLDRRDFAYVTMDTDSAYLSLAYDNIEDGIKADCKNEYIMDVYGRCHDELEGVWFIRECCKKHNTYDRRVPGIMKEEATGDEIIALSSKTYVLKKENKYKISCKGISKNNLTDPLNIFLEVLASRQSQGGENIGFRVSRNTVFTYVERRSGFSYLYCKRKVLSDGVTTVPLDITLSPWDLPEVFIFGKPWEVLSPNFICNLLFEGLSFFSIEHLFTYRFAHFHKKHVTSKAIQSAKTINEVRVLKSMVKSSMKWEERKSDVMYDILVLKMRSDENVRKTLEKISSPFVYANHQDYYWGVGMSARMVALSHPKEYRGRNELGELWSRVQKDFENEYINLKI